MSDMSGQKKKNQIHIGHAVTWIKCFKIQCKETAEIKEDTNIQPEGRSCMIGKTNSKFPTLS